MKTRVNNKCYLIAKETKKLKVWLKYNGYTLDLLEQELFFNKTYFSKMINRKVPVNDTLLKFIKVNHCLEPKRVRWYSE